MLRRPVETTVRLSNLDARRSESPHSALRAETCMVQQSARFPLSFLSQTAQALNRFAIGALVVGVVLNRDLFRVL